MRASALRLTAVFAVAAVGLSGCGGHESRNKGAAGTGTGTPSTGTAPAVTSVAPQNGPQAGGTQVTISGSNFLAQGAGTTFVLFGANAVLVTPTSDTQIVVASPASAASGQVDVRVVNDLGVASSAGAFTFDPTAAALTFDPPVGHFQAGFTGTRITIDVTNFSALTAAATVTFGTTAAAAVRLVDSDTLVAEVPDGLTPGLVTITVDEGGTTVSAAGFRIQGALTYGDLTVNEICANPGGIDTNGDEVVNTAESPDEFIELVNTTANPVDLSYLTLADTFSERHRFPNPTTLPAGAALVVFAGGMPAGIQGARNVVQQATGGALGLNNSSADSVILRTLPNALGNQDILFQADLTSVPIGSSLVNLNDGQRITANPAVQANYTDHAAVAGAVGPVSPGKKIDGTEF